MARRQHLCELLVEDQEPFFLDDYISDRRRQLNRPLGTVIQIKSSSSYRESFVNACFSSSSSFPHNHLKGPVPLPPKARDLPDGEKQGKSAAGSGTMELLFRKFTKLGRRSRKRELGRGEGRERVLVRDILGWNNSGSSNGLKRGKMNMNETRDSYSHNCPWSSSKSSVAPSGSEIGDGREPFKIVEKSSFHNPTPELLSAAASPSCSAVEEKDGHRERNRHGTPPDGMPEDGTNEKEQSSPVSVLDPPSFDDDVEEHDYGTNQVLLNKLYTFERRVTGISPIDLEERAVEQWEAGRMRVTRGMMKMVADLVVGQQEMEGDIEMGWRRNQEEDQSLEDTSEEIELAILGFLVEELLSLDSE